MRLAESRKEAFKMQAENKRARAVETDTGSSGELHSIYPTATKLQAPTLHELTLSEAQRIAESIVGPCAWRGAEAFIQCPGIHRHTKRSASDDCHVVCEPIPNAKPGVYCFHGSCEAEVAALSREVRSALGKRSSCSRQTAPNHHRASIRPAPPVFDPAKLERVARKLDGIDAAWLAARSPKRPDNRTPASFLHELFQPGERVVIFDVFESQGQAVWYQRGFPYDARLLDRFRRNRKNGVWFLANPVTGEYLPNDSGKLSRRSWQNVTSWRYLVLESDAANPSHWLAALAQMPLPISAIYTSGGKSIHALVRIDAESKAHWNEEADRLKPALITLGADRKAISAVRLTRLPACERVETKQMQTLLYLNGSPDETPICEMPKVATFQGVAEEAWQ